MYTYYYTLQHVHGLCMTHGGLNVACACVCVRACMRVCMRVCMCVCVIYRVLYTVGIYLLVIY